MFFFTGPPHHMLTYSLSGSTPVVGVFIFSIAMLIMTVQIGIAAFHFFFFELEQTLMSECIVDIPWPQILSESKWSIGWPRNMRVENLICLSSVLLPKLKAHPTLILLY